MTAGFVIELTASLAGLLEDISNLANSAGVVGESSACQLPCMTSAAMSYTGVGFLPSAEPRRVRSCHSEVCAPILLPAGLIALGTKRPLFSVAEGLNPV